MTKKVLLITGGSRGIGAATSLLAARQGYAVVVNYRSNVAEAERVVKLIEKEGGEAIACQADISNEDSVINLFEQADRRVGKVTALVNNAGILHTSSTLVEMDSARLNHIFATNAIGPFICCREAIKRMSTKFGGKGGAIVNVSSTAIKQGGPFQYIDYAASKGALEVMTIGLAKELAEEGIRVNAVRPGIVDTGIHASGGDPGKVDRVRHTLPMKRPGEVNEIAKAILWLLSEEASYCTGSILDVAGGK